MFFWNRESNNDELKIPGIFKECVEDYPGMSDLKQELINIYNRQKLERKKGSEISIII